MDGIKNFYTWGSFLSLSVSAMATSTFTRDLEEKKHEYRATLVASLFSNLEGRPGAQFRDAAGNFRGRYYPYLGAEYFDPISAGQLKQAHDRARPVVL